MLVLYNHKLEKSEKDKNKEKISLSNRKLKYFKRNFNKLYKIHWQNLNQELMKSKLLRG